MKSFNLSAGKLWAKAGKLSKKISLQEFDNYMDCQMCNNPLPHCHCKCPYCGERDKCECALFDAATGG